MSNKPGNTCGKALVLGSDFKNYRACLAIVRSLGRGGLEVHLGWHAPDEIAAYSRYVKKEIALPPFSAENDIWYKRLTEVLTDERYDIVIPANEQACTPFERNRDKFGEFPEIYMLNQEAFDTVFDKSKTGELARRLKIPMPLEIVIERMDDLDKIEQEIGYPTVLKPRASFEAGNLKRKLYVYKARNRLELVTSVRHLLDYGPVVAQKHVAGAGIGIEFLAKEGKLLFAFQHQRLHEPPLGGGSSYRRSCPLDGELVEYTKAMLEAVSYTGVGMAEFRVDKKSGNKWFFEINGRFWGSIPLAIAAGADFPLMLYQMRKFGKTDFRRYYKENIYCRNSIRDFEWILANMRLDKANPIYNSRSNIEVLGEFANLILGKERNDTLSLDDPKPGVVEMGKLSAIICRKILGWIRRNWPGRWVSCFILRRRLRRAGRIMFVCYGNIYRSPLAEAAARRFLPKKIAVNSAGYYPHEGRRCHQRAIDIAAEFGLDISGHRSKVVNSENVREAELILVFDRENKRWLTDNFPESIGRVAYIGLLRYCGPIEIGDPVDGNLYTVRERYAEIIEAIKAAAKID